MRLLAVMVERATLSTDFVVVGYHVVRPLPRVCARNITCIAFLRKSRAITHTIDSSKIMLAQRGFCAPQVLLKHA